MSEVTYTDVVWTAGDTITEAKMDNMVSNDRAVDAMNNGTRFTERANPSTPPSNTVHVYAKDKNGTSALYCINDAGTVYELGAYMPKFTFPVSGPLLVQSNATLTALLADTNLTIVKAYAYVTTPPVGAAIIIDILKNGSSIWNATPANKVTIADGANLGTQTSFDTVSLAEDDVLTIDIDQVGATTRGSNLTVQLKCK